MPLIKTYETNEATGELKALYDEITALRGRVGNNAKLFSVSPEALRQQLDFIKYYINHPTLSMPLLAAIRILVSSGENCEFCVDYNTGLLVNMMGWSIEDVHAMRKDIDNANLQEKEKALLKFVVKAVQNAHGVNANDLDELREMQWSDKDIFDAVAHGAKMLATDILFNAFKIEKDF
ncbi:hypothetical protein [Sulfurimonas sp. HSL-1716]|uniref:carboxymuconolactone decarboxylase family protein n=1 Tax=Hydrocurvibacter sulfurireducens TaxID=3131937 RepID=UPI0031F93F0B